MGTLVERSTRYTIIVPIESRSSAHVTQAFTQALERLPKHLCRSLTYDRGTEMARHEEFSQCTGMPVFFAQPGCPWQRGSNENTNGLIREFFPKGSSLKDVSDAQLEYVQRLLNHRPRKVLKFQTPEELMDRAMQNPEFRLSAAM